MPKKPSKKAQKYHFLNSNFRNSGGVSLVGERERQFQKFWEDWASRGSWKIQGEASPKGRLVLCRDNPKSWPLITTLHVELKLLCIRVYHIIFKHVFGTLVLYSTFSHWITCFRSWIARFRVGWYALCVSIVFTVVIILAKEI